MTSFGGIRKCWQGITVEPSLAVYLILFEFIKFAETNMILQKTCRFNTTIEPDLNSICDDEKKGQIYVASVNYRFTFIMAGAILFTAVASAWSDTARNFERRHMIFIPMIGQLVLAVFGWLNAYFWTWDPIILVVGGALLEGLTGAKICIVLGSELYISSFTTSSERSFRIGIITAINYIFLPIGAGISGFMIKQFGFARSFLVCIPLELIALAFGYYKIKNTTYFTSKTNHNSSTSTTVDSNNRIKRNGVVPDKSNRLVVITNPILKAFKSMTILFRRRPQHKRLILVCLLLVDPLAFMPYLGEQTVTYLYFRYRFGWQEKAYSVYTAYKMLGTLFGTMFCTVYMSKYLKIHDGFIGTLAAFWDTVGNISYFFADQAWELYVIPLYNIFNGVLFAMMASLSTKCVEPNEMGYLTSVRSLMQIVSPLSFPLYGLVYRTTLDVLPQAFFLLSVLFNFPTIILFGIAYYLSKDIVFETPDTSVTAAVDNTTTPPAVNPAAVTDGLPHHQNGEMKKSIES